MAILVVYGIDAGYHSKKRQGLEFLLFSLFMALGAVCSWAYLPNIQRQVVDPNDGGGRRSRLETKNLEDLGEGRERAKNDGELITIKEKMSDIRRRRRGILHSVSPPSRGYDARGQDISMT